MKVRTTPPSIKEPSQARLRAARHFFLPGVLIFSFASLAQTAAAQANLITFKNVGKTRVNVCVYKRSEDIDSLFASPLRCWRLEPNEASTWRNDNPTFQVQNANLSGRCRRENVRGDVELIEVKEQPCTISITPKQTRVRFCNDNAHKLYVGFAYWAGKDKGWTSTGWRDVPARDCLDVTLWNYEGDIYYYAADDEDGRWTGDTTFCVHWTKGFQIANSDKSSCQGTGYRRVGMSKLAVKPGITTQRLVP